MGAGILALNTATFNYMYFIICKMRNDTITIYTFMNCY